MLSGRQGIDTLANQYRKGTVEVTRTSHFYREERKPQRLSRRHRRFEHTRFTRTRSVRENTDARDFRGRLLEQLQSLGEDLQTRLVRQARDVSARAGETGDES